MRIVGYFKSAALKVAPYGVCWIEEQQIIVVTSAVFRQLKLNASFLI